MTDISIEKIKSLSVIANSFLPKDKKPTLQLVERLVTHPQFQPFLKEMKIDPAQIRGASISSLLACLQGDRQPKPKELRTLEKIVGTSVAKTRVQLRKEQPDNVFNILDDLLYINPGRRNQVNVEGEGLSRVVPLSLKNIRYTWDGNTFDSSVNLQIPAIKDGEEVVFELQIELPHSSPSDLKN